MKVMQPPLRMWRWLGSRWEWRWILRIVGVLVVIGLVAAALVLPSLLIGPESIGDATDRAKARSDLRSALIQGLGVVAVFIAGWYTARTYRLGREGQLTDRFKAGVDLLSGQDVNAAGGLLALERIARDSARDHPVVMELLAMYARTYAPSEEALRTALLIIGRRELRYDRYELRNPFAIDLRELKAEGMRLVDLKLDGADLSGSSFKASLLSGFVARRSRLERAQLQDTDLQGAQLDDANLTAANLGFALLADGKIRRGQLVGANLAGAMLMNADFTEADLSGASLAGAQLHGAVFVDADLARAVLRRSSCSLQRTPPDFRSADLTNVMGQEAVLPRADFRKADLRGANFDGAVLLKADFRGAILEGASFKNSDLTGSRTNGPTGADVTGAIGASNW